MRYTIIIGALLNLGAGVLPLFHSHQAKLKFFAPLMLAVFVGLSYCRNYSLTSLYNGGACGFYNANNLGDQKYLFYEEGSYGYVSVIGQGSGAIKRLLLNGQGSSSLRLSDVRTSTFYDDARHYLQRTANKYDLIANHPLELYQSFSSFLFTKEFLEIAKSRLSDNGLYFQWFPLYDLKPEKFQDFYKTFNSFFPHQMVFVNLKLGENITYEIKGTTNFESQYFAKQNSNELIIIRSARPIPLDLAALRENFARLNPADQNYLKLASLDSPEAIFNLLLFKGEEIKGYYENATFITDDRPSLKFSTPFRLVEKSPRLVNQAMNDVLNFIKLSPN